MTLARLAAHLSEVRTAAELELQYQRAVGHFVYVFAFWREKGEITLAEFPSVAILKILRLLFLFLFTFK